MSFTMYKIKFKKKLALYLKNLVTTKLVPLRKVFPPRAIHGLHDKKLAFFISKLNCNILFYTKPTYTYGCLFAFDHNKKCRSSYYIESERAKWGIFNSFL